MVESKIPMGRLGSEFVVIVIGVLVALAVDAAWEARQERAMELELVDAVSTELSSNIALLDQTLASAARAHDNLERARRISEQGMVADSGAVFVIALLNSTSFSPLPIVSRAAVRDLVSTGRLRVVRSPELRRAILTYDARLDARLEGIARAEANMAAPLTHLISRHLPPNTVAYSSEVGRNVVDDPEGGAWVRQAAAAMADDPEFPAELNHEYRRVERARALTLHLQTIMSEWDEGLSEVRAAAGLGPGG
jgi:hypothetical protein